MTINLNNNTALLSSDLVRSICSPLFNNTCINYFNYVKIFNNNSHISLTTNAEWLRYFLEYKYYELTAFEKLPADSYNKFIIWDLFDENSTIKQAQTSLFNIDHGTTIIRPDIDGTEYFYFATSPENHHINNFYINHQTLLNEFIFYFKQAGSELIEQATLNPIYRQYS